MKEETLATAPAPRMGTLLVVMFLPSVDQAIDLVALGRARSVAPYHS